MKRLEEKQLLLEDNKGGDIVEITKLDDNMISIAVGQSCIGIFDCVMPVSLLAGMLSFLTIEYGNPLKIAKKVFEDNPKWRDKIISKIKGRGLFGTFDYKDI